MKIDLDFNVKETMFIYLALDYYQRYLIRCGDEKDAVEVEELFNKYRKYLASE